jgi:hypothetical protein
MINSSGFALFGFTLPSVLTVSLLTAVVGCSGSSDSGLTAFEAGHKDVVTTDAGKQDAVTTDSARVDVTAPDSGTKDGPTADSTKHDAEPADAEKTDVAPKDAGRKDVELKDGGKRDADAAPDAASDGANPCAWGDASQVCQLVAPLSCFPPSVVVVVLDAGMISTSQCAEVCPEGFICNLLPAEDGGVPYQFMWLNCLDCYCP